MQKMKPAETAAAAAEARFKASPAAKVKADAALKVVNAKVEAALAAFQKAEMAAQSAELNAGNDAAKQAEAKKLRAAATASKGALDTLSAKDQKVATGRGRQSHRDHRRRFPCQGCCGHRLGRR